MYFTFDDGPCPEITNFVLDELNKYQAKASFFCIGKNMLEFPELTRLMLSLSGEAAFLLAELVLTVQRVPWQEVCDDVLYESVRVRVAQTLNTIREIAAELPAASLDPALLDYVSSVLMGVAT